jgi:hypothetical protein
VTRRAVEGSTARDEPERRVGLGRVDLLRREAGLRHLFEALNDEPHPRAVLSLDPHNVPAAERAQVEEHRRPRLGVDVADDDRGAPLTRGRPAGPPSRDRGVGRHLERPIREEPEPCEPGGDVDRRDPYPRRRARRERCDRARTRRRRRRGHRRPDRARRGATMRCGADRTVPGEHRNGPHAEGRRGPTVPGSATGDREPDREPARDQREDHGADRSDPHRLPPPLRRPRNDEREASIHVAATLPAVWHGLRRAGARAGPKRVRPVTGRSGRAGPRATSALPSRRRRCPRPPTAFRSRR